MDYNKRDEDGPRIHKTRTRDRLDKHKNAIYDLIEEEESDFEDDIELAPPPKYVHNGKKHTIRF